MTPDNQREYRRYPIEAPLTPEPGYALTPLEQQVVALMQQRALKAKARIYDLNVARELAAAELDAAQKEMAAAQHEWNGTLRMLALSHGMDNARLTEDMARIVPLENK